MWRVIVCCLATQQLDMSSNDFTPPFQPVDKTWDLNKPSHRPTTETIEAWFIRQKAAFNLLKEGEDNLPRSVAPTPATSTVLATLHLPDGTTSEASAPSVLSVMSMEQRRALSAQLTDQIKQARLAEPYDPALIRRLEQERRQVEGFFINEAHEEVHSLMVLRETMSSSQHVVDQRQPAATAAAAASFSS